MNYDILYYANKREGHHHSLSQFSSITPRINEKAYAQTSMGTKQFII